MKVKFKELENWKDQIVMEQGDSAYLHTRCNPDDTLDTYKAGLRAGMREILAVLKLQGIIEVDYAN